MYLDALFPRKPIHEKLIILKYNMVQSIKINYITTTLHVLRLAGSPPLKTIF